MSQEVIFFFDDSGTLHRKEPSGYFVYAGYVFTGKEEIEAAKRKYVNANAKLKKALSRDDELKACTLKPKHRRALYNSVKCSDSVAAIVEIPKVYDSILEDKKSICRYKDYVLKRCIKSKLEQMVMEDKLSRNKDIKITVFIDEQLTATNGYYDLRDSIKEELEHGIANFDYGTRHPNVFNADVQVYIHYCNSSKNYMIQASDILANRIWTSCRDNDPNLRKKDNQIILTFP